MNAERAFVSMLLVITALGLAFLGLAFGHALTLGDLAAVVRHPLLGSGAASLAVSALGAILFLGLRPLR